ncbi:hypothetical protein FRC10_000563 [Ceratobasidium sp. 414]|nr:hypothetical protein FRC10_000563 [Ceratobasidium sp. 414]
MPGGPVAVQFEEQPLLPERDSREDGLQSGGRGAEPKKTPFPWRNLIVLMALNSICPLAFELIYPFVNAMIVEIGVTDDPERVGFYSGLIVGRLLTRTLRPTTKQDPECSWAAIKVMTGEMTDRSNQGTAFSIMNVSYRLGQIIGLPLGGLLAHPERRWKSFDTPFWREYPFLLPCLVGAVFAIISVGFGTVFIEETLPSKVRARRRAKRAYDSITTPTPSDLTAAPLISSDAEFGANARPGHKTPWRTIMTPSVLALVLNNACMCIASEMLFSV